MRTKSTRFTFLIVTQSGAATQLVDSTVRDVFFHIDRSMSRYDRVESVFAIGKYTKVKNIAGLYYRLAGQRAALDHQAWLRGAS